MEFLRADPLRPWREAPKNPIAGGGRGTYGWVPFSGALAQLVRALPCHGRGCGFEPRRLRSVRQQTSNAEHRTLNTELQTLLIRRWAFDVGRSAFACR